MGIGLILTLITTSKVIEQLLSDIYISSWTTSVIGMLAGLTFFYSLFLLFKNNWLKFFLLVMITGAIGNLMGFFYSPYKGIDFIKNVNENTVFNFADLIIDMGVIGLFISFSILMIIKVIKYLFKIKIKISYFLNKPIRTFMIFSKYALVSIFFIIIIFFVNLKIADLDFTKSELKVNNDSMNISNKPKTSINSFGNYVIIWEKEISSGEIDIWAKIFDSNNNSIKSEFKVNKYIKGRQNNCTLIKNFEDKMFFVWEGEGKGDSNGIFAKEFSSNGKTTIEEFKVNETVFNSQNNPSVDYLSDGGYVIVWFGNGFGDENGIFARIINSNGSFASNEFRINKTTKFNQTNPQVSANYDNKFLVVWENEHLYGTEIRGSIIDAYNGKTEKEFKIVDDASEPKVKLFEDYFLLAWKSLNSV